MTIQTKRLALSAFTALTLFAACKKKETKTEDPTPVTPAPTTTQPTYSSVTLTIAVIDFTTNAISIYTANATPDAKAKAYIVADSVLIDSLDLEITRVAGINTNTNNIAPDVCDNYNYPTYTLRSKVFKIKDKSTNFLKIYENGTLVTLNKVTATYIDNIYPSQNYHAQGFYGNVCPGTGRQILVLR